MMYAIIKTGGKQYKVKTGDVIQVEKIDAEAGSEIDFPQVLMVAQEDNVKVGTPFVEGSKVTGMVETQGRGKKIKIIKFRRRKHYRRQMGHRQWFTAVKITGITV